MCVMVTSPTFENDDSVITNQHSTNLPPWLRGIAASHRMLRVSPDSVAKEIFISRLHHPDPHQRLLSAKMLSTVAIPGDRSALDALLNIGSAGESTDQLWGLDDVEGEVRACSARTIGVLATGIGCSTVCTRLLRRLEDADWVVREASMEALGKVANLDDEAVIHHLFLIMESGTWWAKAIGAEALSQVASRGNPSIVMRLLQLLSDEDWAVRMSACTALGRLSIVGDMSVVQALLDLLQDADWRVRKACIEAIGELAERGCEVAIRGLILRLEDKVIGARHGLDTPSLQDTDVKRAAVLALQRVAQHGDMMAISALRDCYQREPDSRPLLREALSLLCEDPFESS